MKQTKAEKEFFKDFENVTFTEIARALIIGYECALTAEERIRKLYATPPTKGYENQKRADHEKSYCGGDDAE